MLEEKEEEKDNKIEELKKEGEKVEEKVGEGGKIEGKELSYRQKEAVKYDGLKKLCDNILSFSEFIAERELFDYQRPLARRLIYSLLTEDGAELTALYSRQSGKTETIALVVCGLCVILPKLAETGNVTTKFKEGLWVGFFAPTNEQVETIFNRCKGFLSKNRAEEVFKDRELQLKVNKKKRVIEFSNGSVIRMSSAGVSSNIESKTYHLTVSDESQDIPELKQRKSINPMRAFTNGSSVRLGTSNNKLCDFLTTIENNRKLDKDKPARHKDVEYERLHFEYDADACGAVNNNYKRFVESEVAKYGRDDMFIQMSYYLKWDLSVGHFIDVEQFNLMTKEKYKRQSFYYGNNPLTVGIDFAKETDSTVVTVMEVLRQRDGEDSVKKVIDWLDIQMVQAKMNYDDQFLMITQYLENFKNIERIGIDSNGVGLSLADRFITYFIDKDIIIDPINFTAKAKSDMYKHLLQEITSRRVWIPYEYAHKEYQKCKKELTELNKDWKKGLMVVSHGTNKNAHDDYPDSLALGVWVAKEIYQLDVECDINIFALTQNYSRIRR